MRKDMEPLREMERRTKAGEIVPLVMPHRKSALTRFFWELLLGRAIRAWKKQLRLRLERNAVEYGCTGESLYEFKRILATGHSKKRGQLIGQIMPMDSLDAALCMSRHWDGLDDSEVFDNFQAVCGKVTDEDMDELVHNYYNWTVGDLTAFMDHLKSEGRDRVEVEKQRESRCAAVLGYLLLSIMIAIALYSVWRHIMHVFA